MPVPLPSIEPGAFAAFKAGDEAALERIYRQVAGAMCASALEEVGHAAGAARAVEQVVARAWAHKTDFGTSEQLRDLLAAELHEASVREKGRRKAIRRFEEHEGGGVQGERTSSTTMDQNEIWAHIVKAIHPDNAALVAAKRAAAEASRHGAAAHIAGVGKRMSVLAMLGIAVAVIAIIGGGLFFLQRAGEQSAVSTALRSKEAVQTETKAGQRGSMKLGDGSNADLGAEAALTVPKGFPDKMRAAQIAGAARFTVASGKKAPFELRAGSAIVKSAGATFTVMANKDEPVTIKVDSGAITVASDTATRQVAAGQAVRVMLDGSIVEPTADQVAEATSWVTGRLVVSNRSIKDLLPILKRWYNVDVRAEVPLLPRMVSLNAALGATDSVITALEKAANVKQIYLKQQMVLTDAPPKKKK